MFHKEPMVTAINVIFNIIHKDGQFLMKHFSLNWNICAFNVNLQTLFHEVIFHITIKDVLSETCTLYHMQ